MLRTEVRSSEVLGVHVRRLEAEQRLEEVARPCCVDVQEGWPGSIQGLDSVDTPEQKCQTSDLLSRDKAMKERTQSLLTAS